ncbi:Transposase [Jannaschia seosinensis]|nr:Transposase [Jannaschia seosinensis]CUH40526.1 Transposase [Jannaschia seosinensis]
MRHGGVVRDAAVLSAIGIGPDERRRVLGVSVALSEAEVHWRGFLESLVARGLRGVEFIVSDDHSGLRAARRAVLGGATWQRCQFHLARNAIHHAPNVESRKRIGAELRTVWNASTLAKAETALAEIVASYRTSAPKLAAWLEENAPEGLAVFTLPEHHRRRLRTSNPMERSVQQELKRRTVKVRVFPSDDALLRLVSAVLVEIDEKWASETKAYIKWECQDA